MVGNPHRIFYLFLSNEPVSIHDSVAPSIQRMCTDVSHAAFSMGVAPIVQVATPLVEVDLAQTRPIFIAAIRKDITWSGSR